MLWDIYVCVRVTKTSSRFFLSLGLVRFYSRSEEKKIPNRVAFYPRGGDQPFFLPFLPLLPFPFFHFSKLTDSFEPISIQQGCFAPAGQRSPYPLFQFFLEGSVFLRSIKNRDTLLQKSQLTIVDSFSSSKSISLHFPLNLWIVLQNQTLLFSRNGRFFLELSLRFLDQEIEKKEEHDFLPSKLWILREDAAPRVHEEETEGPPRGRRTLTGREASQEDYRKQIISVEILLANSPDTLPRSNVSGHGIVLWNRGRRSCEISFR